MCRARAQIQKTRKGGAGIEVEGAAEKVEDRAVEHRCPTPTRKMKEDTGSK
jgi:hypothetical protein